MRIPTQGDAALYGATCSKRKVHEVCRRVALSGRLPKWNGRGCKSNSEEARQRESLGKLDKTTPSFVLHTCISSYRP